MEGRQDHLVGPSSPRLWQLLREPAGSSRSITAARPLSNESTLHKLSRPASRDSDFWIPQRPETFGKSIQHLLFVIEPCDKIVSQLDIRWANNKEYF